ncbi:MAG: electron transport complex subunit RsxC [Deltaproteobacteria bacterium]|nr:electron transport complex subunit RsxC [Deltaproteobacteria bacterium]
MKTGTFKGGLDHGVFSVNEVNTPIEELPPPSEVTIPLKQHKGKECKAVVKKGQEVKIGQVIGEGSGPEEALVHATVSGKVTQVIKRFPDIRGRYVSAVTIESDGKDEWATLPEEKTDYLQKGPEELLSLIEKAGVVDFGIEAVPISSKLSLIKDKSVNTIIVNGIDTEPFLSAYKRLIIEKAQDIAEAIKVLKKVSGVSSIYLAIEDRDAELKDKISSAISGVAELAVLKAKFPQAMDRPLIKAVLEREVPSPYGIPEDIGVSVFGVEAVLAILDAVRKGKPVIDRVITIAGAINSPKNLRVRIGTPIKDVIEHCQGASGEVAKVIIGGPMMGLAQYSVEVPVSKETSGIFIQSESELATISNQKCISCGWCVDVCPMNLLPNIISSFCEVNMFKEANDYGLSYCIECGCCAYICPVKIPLVHWIKYGKSQLEKEEK